MALKTLSSPLITSDQLQKYVDARKIAEWLQLDDNTPVNPATFSSNTILAAWFMRATGEVLSAASVGRRYEPSTLATLTGAAAEQLVGILAGLVIGYGMRFKVPGLKREDIPELVDAENELKKLALGELIFGTATDFYSGL